MFEFFASPQEFFDPYRGQEFDCVVLNLMTSWSGFDQVVAGVYDVLRPGGVIAFSAFGPDTLHEIRSAWARVDQGPHVHPCMDMHHLGDSLLNSGFSRPIVDADWIRVDYPDIRTLTLDLRHAGFGNILENRRKTLTGKHRYAKFLDQIASISEETPDLGITFEVVYGFGTRQGDSHADIGRVLVNPPQKQ